MKYRTKLFLIFILLIFFTTSFGLVLLYWRSKALLFDDLRSKVLIVAKTSAMILDGNLIERFEKQPDVNNPDFQLIASKMRDIRDANRRNDLYVIYIYSVRPSKEDQNTLEVVVDSSENPKVFASPTESYPEGVKIGILQHLNEPWVPNQLITDRWGTFLSGYAPIFNSEGKYVATLGVNLSADFVFSTLNHLKWLVGLTLALMLLAGFLLASFLSHFVTSSLDLIHEGVLEIGKGNLKTRIETNSTDEFSRLAHTINNMARGLEEHERLKVNFIRYVSKHIMEKILSSDVPIALKGEKKKVTVIFSDICDFTAIAEKLPPEEVVSILNEFLDKMLSIIFSNNGTLDKFIVEGLMVEFGAPLDDPQQEKNAIKTAIEMQLGMAALNRKWEAEGRPTFEMGIGVNTGFAVVGNIGSDKRMDYTAIGDTVNVASRLKTVAKERKMAIITSESTMDALHGIYQANSLGPIQVPGREKPIVAFSIEVANHEI